MIFSIIEKFSSKLLLCGLLILASFSTSQARDYTSIYSYESEDYLHVSNELMLRSQTVKQHQVTKLYNSLGVSYYLKEKSFHLTAPFYYDTLRTLDNENHYQSQQYLALDNISVAYHQKLNDFSKNLSFALTGTLPTKSVIEKEVDDGIDDQKGVAYRDSYSDESLQSQRLYILGAELIYKKISDPIVLHSSLSLTVPILNEARDKDLYKNYGVMLNQSLGFIINSDITLQTEIAYARNWIDEQNYGSDSFVVKGGFLYRYSATAGIELTFLNTYTNGGWQPAISFTVHKRFYD